MSLRARVLFPLCLVLLIAPSAARSITIYDAVADFSATNGNPNGVWSYGDGAGATGAFTAHTDGYTSSTFDGWQNAVGAYPTYYPLIQKNVTSGDLDLGSGLIVPNDVLYMHPGCEPPSTAVCTTGSWSVVRFTAPADGTFAFAGSFCGIGPTSVDIAVSFDEESLDVLSGNTQIDGSEAQAFAFSLGLLAGETVDFRVGPRGQIDGDVTFLELAVTVPEPSSLVLLGCAVASLAGARSRPRKAG